MSHPALFGIYILAYFPHFSLLVRSRLLSHAAPFRIFILIYFPHFSLLLRSRLLLSAAPFQIIILVYFRIFTPTLRSRLQYRFICAPITYIILLHGEALTLRIEIMRLILDTVNNLKNEIVFSRCTDSQY